MKKRLLVVSLVAIGMAMELMAAPAKLTPRALSPTPATVKTNVVPVVTTKVKSPVAPTKSVVTPVKQPAVVIAEPKQEAATSAGGVGLTVKAGTLGGGLEATVGASDYLGFRFGVNMMSAGPSLNLDEGSFKSDMDWLSYGALVDLYVFGGGFRVSGGGLINKNKFKLNADLNESVTLDGQEYRLSECSGQVTFNELAPYVGIGYGNAVGADGHWHFACDFGVMFQGEPKVSATATASDPALQPYVDQALANEVAKIQDDASAFKLYPVISVGVSYRF
ncbi:MAG: hypothetical protein WCI03_14815 [bacterium]|jgi:hypothetical protein